MKPEELEFGLIAATTEGRTCERVLGRSGVGECLVDEGFQLWVVLVGKEANSTCSFFFCY